MKRRNFIRAAAGTLAAVAFTPIRAIARREATERSSSDAASSQAVEDVDPYFLDSGNLDANEQEQVETYFDYIDKKSTGKPAVMPRGGRPKRAPTYRFLRWQGELNDPSGKFVGPLSSAVQLPGESTYRLNAQILGFHAASDDWPGKYNTGTLSIEFRTRIRGESLTWLYAEQFELYKGGYSSLGLEYIGQRDGVPMPICCDESNIDLRIQLMRNRTEDGGSFLGKVFKLTTNIMGLSSGDSNTAAGQIANLVPPVRVPQMVQEGIAFSQALFGSTAEEAPLWRSGFTSLGIAEGGSRLALESGLWVVLDEARQIELRNARLEDVGGQIALTNDSRELDVNYLVLAVEIEEGPLPDIYYAEPPAMESEPMEFRNRTPRKR
jgi:hypothetical protein